MNLNEFLNTVYKVDTMEYDSDGSSPGKVKYFTSLDEADAYVEGIRARTKNMRDSGYVIVASDPMHIFTIEDIKAAAQQFGFDLWLAPRPYDDQEFSPADLLMIPTIEVVDRRVRNRINDVLADITKWNPGGILMYSIATRKEQGVDHERVENCWRATYTEVRRSLPKVEALLTPGASIEAIMPEQGSIRDIDVMIDVKVTWNVGLNDEKSEIFRGVGVLIPCHLLTADPAQRKEHILEPRTWKTDSQLLKEIQNIEEKKRELEAAMESKVQRIR